MSLFSGTRFVSPTTLRTSFDRRSFALGMGGVGVGMLLAGRLGYLSIAENEKYKTESESNRVNLTLIPPRRGWFLDRNGAPLASNRADFRVDLIPERLNDKDRTVTELRSLLSLSDSRVRDLRHDLDTARGYAPVEVASGITYDQYAAVTLRQPELPGVVPQRGFSRYYPTGLSVGHLLGYVGAANAEEYDADHNPLLITPGYKIGKAELEKEFEQRLRGKPGARRVEVTASGRIVRDLSTRPDVQGNPVKLTIDGPLQDYAARRLGPQSGTVMVIDTHNGDILAMVSMPTFDPNSFSNGIGSVEYAMLRQDERVPLRNKVLKGLYPPGSTVKPMVAMSFLEAGLDPKASTICNGGLRVGNRVFHCWKRSGHGHVDMEKGIYQSCDVYFYYFAQKMGMDIIAAMGPRLGFGQQFPLPTPSQFYGTMPSPAWKLKKYGKEWQAYDTVNATIGQGYMLISPLQMAVYVSRLATGKKIMPRLLYGPHDPAPESMNFHDGHVAFIQNAMNEMVNGAGTGHRAQLPIEGVKLAGKSGTAQVVSLSVANGKSGPWKYRDHGHFMCFAPFDNPRYACAVTIEHSGTSSAAMPVARDVMTFLFDPGKALDALHTLEKQWGGTAQERYAQAYAQYAASIGTHLPPPVPHDDDIAKRVDAEARAAALNAEQLAQKNAQAQPDLTDDDGGDEPR